MPKVGLLRDRVIEVSTKLLLLTRPRPVAGMVREGAPSPSGAISPSVSRASQRPSIWATCSARRMPSARASCSRSPPTKTYSRRARIRPRQPAISRSTTGEAWPTSSCPRAVAWSASRSSRRLSSYRASHPLRAAYVLGPERGVLTPELAARCQHLVRIPAAFSLNVATAGAIVMYDRLRSLGPFASRPCPGRRACS